MGKIGEGAIENRALAFFSVVAINSNLSTTGAKVMIFASQRKNKLFFADNYHNWHVFGVEVIEMKKGGQTYFLTAF